MGHCGHHHLSLLPKCVDTHLQRFYPTHSNSTIARIKHVFRNNPLATILKRHQNRKCHSSWTSDSCVLLALTIACHLGINRVVECFEWYLAYLIIVDKCSRYMWVFLRKSKEPPVNLVKAFLAIHGSQVGGAIRTNQGGELAQSTSFRTNVYKATKYAIEPTGADSTSQNEGAEKWNHTLTVTTLALLYGAGLPARYWSVAFLHSVYMHNRQVHAITNMTPFKGWFGRLPNLKQLRIFGSHVCVQQTGK
jgi:hypothetical protein